MSIAHRVNAAALALLSLFSGSKCPAPKTTFVPAHVVSASCSAAILLPNLKAAATLLHLPGRSVVLLAGGERSCRTCLDPNVSFPGSCLQEQQLQGAAWLFVSGYAAYQDGLLLQAVHMAKQVSALVLLPRCARCYTGHVTACMNAAYQDTLQLQAVHVAKQVGA
jgi:hypothetical protein